MHWLVCLHRLTRAQDTQKRTTGSHRPYQVQSLGCRPSRFGDMLMSLLALHHPAARDPLSMRHSTAQYGPGPATHPTAFFQRPPRRLEGQSAIPAAPALAGRLDTIFQRERGGPMPVVTLGGIAKRDMGQSKTLSPSCQPFGLPCPCLSSLLGSQTQNA